MATLAQVLELVTRYFDGRTDGQRIDVLSLSYGFFHESAADTASELQLRTMLRALSVMGTVVVCAAGNEATARPRYPAAFGPWRNDPSATLNAAELPIVSVGALNPNGTEALFSNTGPWVRAWATGAALVSTIPSFKGGYLPSARIRYEGRIREGIDPDDFTGQFATWSGTSFSAPLIAGRIAARLLKTMPGDEATHRATSVTRAWSCVAAETDIVAP